MVRFIPACAGNTPWRYAGSRIRSVHPRVCGEHPRNRIMDRSKSGSSPRVRGTRGRPKSGLAPRRFIPACAGNTAPRPRRAGSRPVHPRVCGEHTASRSSSRVIDGSSPRVRGTRAGGAAADRRDRFIPACAGNTSARSPDRPRSQVHPRVCGEHGRGRSGIMPGGGSSPRVRGTHAGRTTCRALLRFIPACAGNTQSCRDQGDRPTVHPRVCGEHDPGPGQNLAGGGSSPRVRGTHFRRNGEPLGDRFIPACAGNTPS